MTSKRAFLVLAPESHGGHLVTDLLVYAGCHGGSGNHVDWTPTARVLVAEDAKPWDSELPTDRQGWDDELPTDEDPVVWRRSVPHQGEWLDLDAIVSGLEARGYSVRVVVVTRDLHAAVQSQLKWHHVESADAARDNIQRAYREIFTQLARRRVPLVVTSYEALVRFPAARERLVADLGLALPDGSFKVWDGDEKWYSATAEVHAPPSDARSRATAEPYVDTGFPEAWFPPAGYLAREYHKRVRLGTAHMSAHRAVFCGLARDIEPELPSALARIELMGSAFADHRGVVYENDSSDGTTRLLHQSAAASDRLDVISETLGTPSWGSTRDRGRMAHLAACRNRVLTHVLERYSDFDYAIVLDLDLPRGFSYDGLATTFGYEGWDWTGSNGISGPRYPEEAHESFFYDAWAFRWPGDEAARPFDEINRLHFRRGSPPVPVWSCFGGLAVYRMEALRSGARYAGGDCEHVALHDDLRRRGFSSGFLNPSQIALYSERGG